jgi:hypothetical protein
MATTKKAAPKKKKAAPKKKGAPTKSCPKCNKSMHAATRKCKCGFEFPARKKKKKKRAKKRSAAASISRGDGDLSKKLAESIRVIEKSGGLAEAKKVLAAVKMLEK